jgi:hypothetical protein
MMRRTERPLQAIWISSVVVLLTFLGVMVFQDAEASTSDFGENIRIDDTDTSPFIQGWPVVSSFRNNIYSAWEDTREGQMKIYLARSTDQGYSFQQNTRVDDSPNGSFAENPSVSVSPSGTTYVAWSDDRDGMGRRKIFLARSMNDGESFEGSSRVNSSLGTDNFDLPAVAASSGRVGVAWLDTNNRNVYYAESLDEGQTFNPTIKANDGGCGSAWYPDLAINETGTAFVAWESNVPPKDMICFSRSVNGSSFSPSVWVSNDPTTGGQRMPSIALTSNGTIVVVWRDYRNGGGYEIRVSRSFDGGGNFTAPVRADDYSGPEWKLQPSVSVTPNGKIFVAWLDQRGGSLDLYVSNTSVGGSIFGENKKVNDGGGLSFVATPSNDIHASDVGVFLVWQDDRKGDWDTYFARSPSLPRPPLPPTSLRATVNDTLNVRLDWVASESPNVTHYLIYRSEDQTDFDFSTPIHDTSSDTDPLRTNWTDIGAASAVAPSEYYYVVQAVNEQGLKSITSNTAGKWTNQFNEGLNAFSLPLEPFDDTNISWFADNIPNATYVSWMNDSGRWVKHYAGTNNSSTNTIAEIGDAYETRLENASIFTFCGFPGSMIRFAEGRVGDSIAFRNSFNATVQNEDIVLDWLGIGNISGYNIYRSERRNGLHNLSLQPVARIDSSVTSWRDVNILGKGDEYYYMVIPVDTSGGLGSSTYSIGVFARNYSIGSDTFSLPLKTRTLQSIDWYCDSILNAVGMAYMISEVWKFHAREMPSGTYDSMIQLSDGYQISISGLKPERFTFVGW